ncbi:MAG: HipA domain-containing protein [Candidatus Omnitrophica bacterium]|nr:HipA domain-containing protein [Candidatus Omnitrophota bacterium]
MNEKFLKEMFNSSKSPVIDFGSADISQEAQKLAGKLSISGVQPKLSVKLDKKQNMLIVVNEGGEYLLKPQTPAFAHIPENEQCCMDIAQELNIDVPPHCLLPLKDKSLAYVVKRFDREKGTKIHQEDFAQILEENDKYKGSVEQIGRKLKEISSAPGYDAQLLFERVVLNFILGNGDAHLKNYSISYKGDNRRLSPAYDIVCSRLAILKEKEESAININGKKSRLLKADFDKLAEYLNVPVKVRYENFGKKFDTMKRIIKASQIDKAGQAKFLDIIKERSRRLELSE